MSVAWFMLDDALSA